jgi:hypothetical protein
MSLAEEGHRPRRFFDDDLEVLENPLEDVD